MLFLSHDRGFLGKLSNRVQEIGDESGTEARRSRRHGASKGSGFSVTFRAAARPR